MIIVRIAHKSYYSIRFPENLRTEIIAAMRVLSGKKGVLAFAPHLPSKVMHFDDVEITMHHDYFQGGVYGYAYVHIDSPTAARIIYSLVANYLNISFGEVLKLPHVHPDIPHLDWLLG